MKRLATLPLFLLPLLLAPSGCSKDRSKEGKEAKPSAASLTPASTRAPAGELAAKAAEPRARAADPGQRVGDSIGLLFDEDKAALAAYHLEVVGTSPEWDRRAKKQVEKKFSMSADVQGKSVRYTYEAEQDGKAEKIEAVVLNGGATNEENGGKEWKIVDGKPRPGFALLMRWVSLPLELTFPLVFGATGTTPAGEEAVEGRTAEKYALDSAKAPAGVVEGLSGMFTYTGARGTAWVDKETGALLRMQVDYEQNLIDPPGSKQVVGKGKGHLEMTVSKVGQVTVSAPAGAE